MADSQTSSKHVKKNGVTPSFSVIKVSTLLGSTAPKGHPGECARWIDFDTHLPVLGEHWRGIGEDCFAPVALVTRATGRDAA